MSRARKPCPTPGCPNLQPCTVHAPEPWAGSTRRERTVSGWEQQRRARRVIDRGNGICHVCGQPGADEADHVIPLSELGPDTEDNMAPIHSRPCHAEKSQQEAARARAAKPNV